LHRIIILFTLACLSASFSFSAQIPPPEESQLADVYPGKSYSPYAGHRNPEPSLDHPRRVPAGHRSARRCASLDAGAGLHLTDLVHTLSQVKDTGGITAAAAPPAGVHSQRLTFLQ
jgi:hypothetical protein